MITTLPTASYDNKIYAKFSKNTIEKKKLNKEAFQKEFGLNHDIKTLLISISVELTSKNGFDILEELLKGISSIGVQIAIRGIGTEKFQKIILDFAENHHGKIAILEDTEENLRKIYASCDSTMFFSSNEDVETEIKNSLAYACIPIAPKQVGFLEDYNPNQESGNSFLFKEGDVWSAYAAIVRVNENYRFPYDWKTICKNTLEN
ncbi:MAG: hypothetical protein N4A36_01145 [Candidatus Gracilibacteria bacterium]|jgi:starch synthase|nr:hypothetical protein [Candidatus Gracilibacteria bacterium]